MRKRVSSPACTCLSDVDGSSGLAQRSGEKGGVFFGLGSQLTEMSTTLF